jgi:tetratricopeptide (TPR) repeat protein
MTRLIRGLCVVAALSAAAGVLASCAGRPAGGTAFDESAAGASASAHGTRLSPRTAILVAFRSWKHKNYSEAIRLANQAINSGRLHGRGLSLAYFVRGLAHHSTNRYAAASADYTASVRSDPTNHLAYHSRGLIRTIQHDNLGALADLSTAIRIHPTVTSHYVRGLVNLRLRRFDDALADANTVIAMRPNDYHGYYLRGLAHHFQGQHKLAAADYRRVLEINPAHKGALRALELLGRGRPRPPVSPRKGPDDVHLLPVSATATY